MFEYKEEFSLGTCVCLNITDFCNCMCTYCFCDHKPHYMDLQTARDSVDYVIKNLNRKKELGLASEEEKATITFFGGEPTLLYEEIIVPTIKYVEEIYPNLINFNMTTNGTLLNQERIDFLAEHNVAILLSIDGNKTIQDKNRPCRNGESSFDLLAPNIPLVLEKFPCTTFRATLDQNNCKDIFENTVLFAAEQGFTNIFLCPNAREIWTIKNQKILHQEINKLWTYFIVSYLNNERPINCGQIDKAFEDILRLDLQTYNKDYDNIKPQRKVFRCGLGAHSYSIAYDGSIFSCQEQDSRDTNDYFYIGNIYSGIDQQKHLQILNDFNTAATIYCEKEDKCVDCPLRQVCIEETCPSVSHDRFNNLFIRPEIDCLMEQWMFENASVAMDILKQENNQLFKEYLDDIYKIYKKEGK